jgi:hypothetical protein
MEFAVVTDLARLRQHQSRGFVWSDHHVPVVVIRGGGMGKPVLVDPFDGVADLRADLGRCVDQSVDGDLNVGGLRRDG